MADATGFYHFHDTAMKAREILEALDTSANDLVNDYVNRCNELRELYRESGSNHLLVYNLQKGKLTVEEFYKAWKMPIEDKEKYLEGFYDA